MSLIKKYNCSHCNYGSDRKWTIKDHERRVHNNINVTNQSNEAPTTQYGIQPISHYESTSAEVYPPNIVTMGEYNNVIGETYKWKDA